MNTKFLQTIRKLRHPIFAFSYNILFRRKMQKFYNSQKGKTILIVGNGPSLNNTPLEKFNIPSIGMNKINLLFSRTKWRPNYIICTNGLVINQNRKFFKETKIPVILDMKAFFFGVKSKNINYFLTRKDSVFSSKFDRNVGAAGTVTFSALQFSAFLGVKRIIIVGVDHSFQSKVNEASIEKMKNDDVNHFDPNYFKGMHWGIPNLALSEIGYKSALNYFNKHGIEIFDATINGKLNIFPKININQAIDMAEKG